MMRSAASKVMWVGRATVFLVGVAVILALVFGAASMALGADGKPFIVGEGNSATKVSTLTKSGAGPALSLKVGRGAPLAVNSETKVANLNADKLDGRDSASFASKISEAWHEVGAPREPAFGCSLTIAGCLPLWENYGGEFNTVGFYKDSSGVVHLKGLAKVASGTTLGGRCVEVGNSVFILPQGYRPAAREIRPTLRGEPNTLSRIDILTSGEVTYCDGTSFSSGQWLSLDGIEFRAAN